MNTFSEKLKNLAEFDPPAGGWARLTQRMHAQQRRRRVFAGGLALAASLLLAVGITVLPSREAAPPSAMPETQQVAPAAAQSADVAQLMRQSRALENRLQRVRPRVQVWDSQLALRAANLEKDVALVDVQLNYADAQANPDDARRLWQNRVELMSQLVQTHWQAAQLTTSGRRAQEIAL